MTRNAMVVALAFCSVIAPPLAIALNVAHDPILVHLPEQVQQVCADVFPGHRALRVARNEGGRGSIYRVTLFSPAEQSANGKLIGNELVTSIPLYDLEVTADGKVLQESLHLVPESRIPKTVVDGYRRWNPRGLTGMGVFWSVELEKGKERIYSVVIHFSSVQGFRASFKEDGRVVTAEPARIP